MTMFGVWRVTRVPYLGVSQGHSLGDRLSQGWEPFAVTCDSESADYVFLRRFDAGAAQTEPTADAD